MYEDVETELSEGVGETASVRISDDSDDHDSGKDKEKEEEVDQVMDVQPTEPLEAERTSSPRTIRTIIPSLDATCILTNFCHYVHLLPTHLPMDQHQPRRSHSRARG